MTYLLPILHVTQQSGQVKDKEKKSFCQNNWVNTYITTKKGGEARMKRMGLKPLLKTQALSDRMVMDVV